MRDPSRSFGSYRNEPIELWLPWATVFVAQGLSHWVRDFAVRQDPSKADAEDVSVQTLLARRRAYFAGEVLATAAHHHIPSLSLPLWFSWPASSDVTDGRITKAELLRWTLDSGECLPFREPHVVDGYAAYGVKLRRVTEDLPARFGTDVLDLTWRLWRCLRFSCILGMHLFGDGRTR